MDDWADEMREEVSYEKKQTDKISEKQINLGEHVYAE